MRPTITKIFTFDAAHSLTDYDGPCARLHGHTYKLEVTVAMDRHRISQHDGMIIDFGELKHIVHHEVIDKLDHQYLNEVLDFRTTAENMAQWMFKQLDEVIGRVTPAMLQKVRLWETPNSYAEVTK